MYLFDACLFSADFFASQQRPPQRPHPTFSIHVYLEPLCSIHVTSDTCLTSSFHLFCGRPFFLFPSLSFPSYSIYLVLFIMYPANRHLSLLILKGMNVNNEKKIGKSAMMMSSNQAGLKALRICC